MIRQPPTGDAYLGYLVGALNAEFNQREPVVLGSRFDGSDWIVRWRASTAALRVQVHVQSTNAGEGGVAAYDPDNYTSSTLVDCRAGRRQTTTVSSPTGGEQYVMFLIPVYYGVDGTASPVKMDGVDGTDEMAFAYYAA